MVRLLTKGDAQAAAQALAYPPNYSPAELEADTEGVASVLNVLFSQFGKVSEVAVEGAPIEFYEVGVGTGANPFWWQVTQPPARTRQYVYRVLFSRAGPGVIKVLTRVTPGTEQVVALFFGFPVELPSSKRQVESAHHAVLDRMGIPANHPAREQPVQLWRSPPASRD